MILAATLLCDREACNQLVAVPTMAAIDGDVQLYVNIETLDPSGWRTTYAPLLAFLRDCPVPNFLDVWSPLQTWREHPTSDEGGNRLAPIVMGRNMAIDCALTKGASHLLFVDADVVVKPDGLGRLLAHKLPLCGGYVPGRGNHPHIFYCSAEHTDLGSHILADYGTCGYMLIERRVFSLLRFRWGGLRRDPDYWQSEDPAYCRDARDMGFGHFLIDKTVTAEHRAS
jgi:hypothetical protein